MTYFKVCIVGDSKVGKTTLLHQYLSKKYISDAERTIGSNFFVKRLKLPDIKEKLTLQVWDLAGQDHFKWVRNAFYKGAKGIVYVYDLKRIETFEHLFKWKEEIETVLGVIPNILVGNKLDLLNPYSRKIKEDEINHLKKELSAIEYFETSAKIGINVDPVFIKLAYEMYRKFAT
jgi:small GTP-binding protein